MKATLKLVTCPLSPPPYHSSSSWFIYRPRLTGREKMAAAGSRHVMASCREVNDGLAVIPEAPMEIGRTHILLLTTHARTQRWMSEE